MLKFIRILLWSIFIPIATIIVLWLSVMIFLYIKYPDMDCENTNPIFQKYTYDSEEYQLELIRLLKESDLEETRFWFDGYVDPTHINIRIQDQDICAKALVTVHKMEGKGRFMNHLMSVKGVSYGGPLVGVEFDFEEDALQPQIILASVEDIID